jgi:hypothetical protein
MAVGEWDQRQLCPDGACIGVIGPDGTCKACGRAAPNWGDERKRGLLDPPDETDDDEDEDEEDDDLAGEDEDEDEDDEDDELAAASEHAVAAATPRSDWTARQLCPDGACIGVIDADGRCKVCGRSASDAPAEAAAAPTADAASEPAAPATASSPPASETAAPATDPREPCADSSCSGLIGTDGRCEVCGKGAP